jgi:hypothetical protein
MTKDQGKPDTTGGNSFKVALDFWRYLALMRF